MTKEIVLQTINNANRSGPHLLKYLKTNLPNILNGLIELTSFLDQAYVGTNYIVPLQARLYCIEHDIRVSPRCQNPNCPTHSLVDWCRNTQEFRMYCSYTCLQASPLTKSKRNNTFNSKYGGHPMKSTEIKERAIHNNKMRHGGIHSSSVPEVKAKVAATNMQRYGVTCSL